MSKKSETIAKLSGLAFAATMLAACGSTDLVDCYGVAKSGANVPLLMTKEMCDSLDSSRQVPLKVGDYVQCYGVAGAGKNGCATKTNSCGGKMKKPRAPDAWVSLPLSVCQNLKGGVVGKSGSGQ
jgi:uncharacterized membrane protein